MRTADICKNSAVIPLAILMQDFKIHKREANDNRWTFISRKNIGTRQIIVHRTLNIEN